ncbi:hypothetical protein [Clostridium grantii]|uniref:Uncharacterized protein n=1 Tax=Clostridium grantii DSM 8605 TaxID=1121316 RepID=A0A1M5XYW9_9CLOT|nr:hypothetical protein [Clostridium grantii]SHI04473.1 hypothetical protein SAMN02745207_04008 [Clostridium grantii DSM 8605]
MNDIVKTIDTNNYSINIKNDYMNPQKINAYYPTFRNLKLLEKFLTMIYKGEGGSILLSGAYGTGKSYFTSVLMNILDKDYSTKNYTDFLKKSNKIYDVNKILHKFEKKKYFIVFIEDNVSEFSKGLLLGINQSAKKTKINLNLSTQYEIIEQKLAAWKKDYASTYEEFINKIKEKGIEEKFFTYLQERDNNAVKIFSLIYSELFSGEKFAPLEKVMKMQELLIEVEESVKEAGYDGVIYLFDEFGRYLETNINNIDVKEIQDMAEHCNEKNESTLMLITHKDIFQYGTKLDRKAEKDEWEKVSGRFLKEHLIYEKVNILEILQNILQKENYLEYRENNIRQFETKEKLLEKLKIINDTAYNITEKFYPMDYIAVNVLPDLSQKLAQNERTLFSFICGNEENSLKNRNEQFITLPEIYDFFEENLRLLAHDSNEYKIYINSKNVLSKIKDNEPEKIKFIKSIAIIYIYNKFAEIEPTPEVMKYIMGKTDILKIETELKDKNLINYRRHLNHYKIIEDIDVNVDKEVSDYIEKNLSNFDPVETLEKNLKQEIYYPLKYNDENKINRYFGQYYIDVSDISRLSKLDNIYEDGKILYITNIENNENYLQIVNKLKEKDYIVIFNKSGKKLNIMDNLKELEAINSMILLYERYSKEGILKQEIESYKKEIKDVISKKIEKYFEQTIDFLQETDRYLSEKYYKYFPINYELINKHNLSFPMKKARVDILNRILNKENLGDEYFSDTKAESSVARILMKNERLYVNEQLSIKKSTYAELIEEIIDSIKHEKVSLKNLYENYCSNKGVYGIRKGIFTFILGVIIVDNYEEISITYSGTKNEADTDLLLLNLIEKNPEKFDIAYYSISKTEVSYMKELENIFNPYISKKEEKIYNRVLAGIKNYVLSLPRFMTGIYLKNYKGLDKVLRGIFSINSGREFLLKDIPRAYKEENYKLLCQKIYYDITSFENNKKEFVNLLVVETVELLGYKGYSLRKAIDEIKKRNMNNDIVNLLITIEDKDESEILSLLTERIKGYNYENWRNEKDISDYKELLQKELQVLPREINTGKKEVIKIIVNGKERVIPMLGNETMLGKMLQSKIESTLKNMGTSVSEIEKKRILAKILLEI